MAMQKNAATLVLPGEEDIKKLMAKGKVDIEWMMPNGTTKLVNKFKERKPTQLREDSLALPTLYLHTLDKKFTVQEDEYNLNMRSGNDNSEIIIVFPEELVRQQRLDLDAETTDAWETVVAYLHGQGEVMVNDSKAVGGKAQAKMNRHRLCFHLKTSRPKAGISLPKKLFGIPEEAGVYLFVENHISVNFMTEKDRTAIEHCIGSFSEDPENKSKIEIATFLKIFFEGGFAYNEKRKVSGGYIPINASITCLGVTPAFEGQVGIGTGFPYKLDATHLPFIDTVPVTIGAIGDMSDRHKRYGLCFTRCVHVWEGPDFASTGELEYSAILPHGGFYYVPGTLAQHRELGGLVYAFGESTEGGAEAANETASTADAADDAADVDAVQVCFCVDCTASMGDWIDQAKEKVIAIADSITAETRGLSCEMSFVCFRDFDMGEADNILFRDFTTNIADLKGFIGTLRARSGRGPDFPEDVEGGLKAAMGLKWLPGAKKFLVLVGDAPCHGTKFHNIAKDNHPNATPPDAHIEKMKNDKIQLIFLRITKHTDKMISEFKKIYEPDMSLSVVDLSAAGASAFQQAITQEVVANLA